MNWENLKRLFKLRIMPTDADGASIQKLVSRNLLNRRKNFRVQYPPCGSGGPYPTVYFMGTELIVSNISVGGCLVVDDTEKLGTTVGDLIALDFVWPTFRTSMRARIVGVTLEKRHIQFVDFDTRFFVLINQLVPHAMNGSRFRHVQNEAGRLAAAEMWTSHMSDTLIFNHDGSAELSLGGEKILFGSSAPGAVSGTKLSSVYVMLANFPNPSERVSHLLETIGTKLDAQTFSREGTDG